MNLLSSLDGLFVDANGCSITKGIEPYFTKGEHQLRYKIWWSKIPSKAMSAAEVNKLLERLDKEISYKETREGCKTISTLHSLLGGYFVRNSKKDAVEICGVYEEDGKIVFARVVSHKGQVSSTMLNGGEAYAAFKQGVQEEYSKTVQQIFGSLPADFHQYRYVCPIQLDWAYEPYTNRIIEGITKADVSSAYGYELTKTLPDLHSAARLVIKGTRAEPTEEYPFAFYLKSGHMAIYNEGASWDYYDRPYFKEVKSKAIREVEEKDDVTLLCRGTTQNLTSYIERLYAARKVSPENKDIMNLTVGMWWRKDFYEGMEVMWPISAVVHFRCNARMADKFEQLLGLGQLPILINTDSITWIGDDISLTEPKKLGSFTLEHSGGRMIIKSVKAYQIEDYRLEKGDKVCSTRWSGRRKEYTESLSFGDILDEDIGEWFKNQEKESLYRWDSKRRRFITMAGGLFNE